MLKYLLPVVSLFTIAGASLHAQPLDSLVASGYSLPTGAAVAPGQVLRLFVQEVGATLTGPVFATSLPLPTTLADISISVAGLPVPIFAVVPFSSCDGTVFASDVFLAYQSHPCRSFVAITLQVPFEMPVSPVGGPSNTAVSVDFIISEGGVAKVAVAMNTNADQVHVLTDCDTPLASSAASQANAGGCNGLVYHSDGSAAFVTKDYRPAQPGEQLVMYALGLGPVSPQVQTGQPSPSGAAVQVIQIGFDFSGNARPKPPLYQIQNPNLVFAGLTPGSVGLYQINFTVPQPPPGTASCPIYGSISNLTVSVGNISFDGAAFCVAVK